MADPEQQTVKLKCVHCGEYQWNPCDAVFCKGNENTGIFNNLSKNYRKSWMRAVMFNFTMGPSVDIISTFTTALIYVLGVRWILAPDMTLTVGVLIAFTAYIGRFWAPINTLAGFYNSLLTAISYLERIFETIDEPVGVRDEPDAIPMPEVAGEVKFSHVSFGYEPGQKILEDINFTAKPGETYAIVGPTGAGKSTIVNLISRFYNVDSGKITIDGIDISKVTLHSLRTQMGIMMQDSFILRGRSWIISAMATAVRRTRKSSVPQKQSAPMILLWKWKTDIRHKSMREEAGYPPDSGSSFPLRGHCLPIRRF